MNEEINCLKKIQILLRNKFEIFIVSDEVKHILLTYGSDNDRLLITIIKNFKRYANKEILKLREIHKQKLIKKIDSGDYDDGMSEIKHIKNIIGDMLLERENDSQ